MQNNWYWLLVGLIPYSVKRQQTKNKQIVYVRALFWHCTICWQQGRCSWDISSPWIERWRP